MVTPNSLNCLRCQGTMERGFVPDGIHGGFATAKWVAGEPAKSFWTGIKLSGKEQLPVATYRCRRCGYLESYA